MSGDIDDTVDSGNQVDERRIAVDAAVLIALSALVSLVVHQLAYLIAYPSLIRRSAALGDHGHLSTQWAIVTPIAVVGAAALIVRQVRNLGITTPTGGRWFAMCAGSMFVVQEVIEGLQAGQSVLEAVSQPAVLLGVVLAPLVSMAMLRLLHRVGEFAAEAAKTHRVFSRGLDTALEAPRRVRVPASVLICVAAPRGPPALVICP